MTAALAIPHLTDAEWDRFVDKIEFTADAECWDWQGSLRGGGYGRFWLRTRHVYAHRLVYELLVQAVPPEIEIDHLCRNARCVNPDHLEPVTSRENTARGSNQVALFIRRTHCNRGHLLQPPNLVRRSDGVRQCRTCCDEYRRRYRVLSKVPFRLSG